MVLELIKLGYIIHGLSKHYLGPIKSLLELNHVFKHGLSFHLLKSKHTPPKP
jgi:hypothetical protein